MKVILASSVAPFNDGGATLIVDWLAEALREAGHAVELLKFPFSSHHEEMLDQMLAFRLMDLSQHGDRLIAIRTPSYLLRHPHKVIWFIHHHRGAYDLWGTPYQDLPDTPEGLRYRDAIRGADNLAFSEARKIYANSQVVAARLKKFNGVDAPVLYPPLHRPERYSATDYGDYLFYPSRLTHHKRQWLAIDAMRHTETPVKLLIAGRPDADAQPYLLDLQSRIKEYGLADRVSIASRWLSEEEKVRLFSECLAGVYIPLDEDSYGYPSLEAHAAAKAVISTADSGGTHELLTDGVNGFLPGPDSVEIARAMDTLYRDRDLARRMGEAGQRRIEQLGISWRNVLEQLLQ